MRGKGRVASAAPPLRVCVEKFYLTSPYSLGRRPRGVASGGAAAVDDRAEEQDPARHFRHEVAERVQLKKDFFPRERLRRTASFYF